MRQVMRPVGTVITIYQEDTGDVHMTALPPGVPLEDVADLLTEVLEQFQKDILTPDSDTPDDGADQGETTADDPES